MMIKEWTTVISWKHGVAQVRCMVWKECDICQSQKNCETCFTYKISSGTQHCLEVISQLPLAPGQLVEIGIKDTILLYSAFLAYMLPLLGFISGAVIFQNILSADPMTACGGILGGLAGFLFARYRARHAFRKFSNQPVILQVAPLHSCYTPKISGTSAV